MRQVAVETCTISRLEYDIRVPSVQDDMPMQDSVRRNLYLIFKEALNNVLRHAQATKLTVDVRLNGEKLTMTIEDNGRGLAPGSSDRSRSSTGHGLQNMRKRAEEIGAKLTLESPNGGGTRLRLEVMLTPEAPGEGHGNVIVFGEDYAELEGEKSMTEPKPIRVVLIEDHEDFREGLSHMLRTTEGFRCVGKFASVEEALGSFPEADVVLLDIGLPGRSGIDGIGQIRKRLPNAQIVMLTGMDDDTNIFRSILAGANGYLLKKTPPVKLLHAIEDAAHGGMPMTPMVARKAMEMFKKYVPAERSAIALTPREREILALLVDGLPYAAIGEKLFISLDTVRNHIRHIYEKLHVHSKSQAVAKALKQGLI